MGNVYNVGVVAVHVLGRWGFGCMMIGMHMWRGSPFACEHRHPALIQVGGCKGKARWAAGCGVSAEEALASGKMYRAFVAHSPGIPAPDGAGTGREMWAH